MKARPYVEPRPLHPAVAVMLILGLVLAAWAVVLTVMLGAIVVLGGIGPLLVVVAGAAIMHGLGPA